VLLGSTVHKKTKERRIGRQTETNSTKKYQTNTRKGQAYEEGKPTTPKRTKGSETNRTNHGRKGARGEEGKRRPAEKERGRPGRQQGQREKTAEAKKAGRCSFSGVRHRLRGFWTTQGRI